METPTISAGHRSDNWIRGGFALALVIFAAIAVSAYIGMSSYVSNTRSVEASNDLHMRLDDLVSSLKDIQRGARGYVITSDTAFLGPYVEGGAAVRRGFEALRELPSTSKGEPGEFEIIEARSGHLLALSNQMVGFMREGEPDSARALVQGGDANQTMARIEAVVRRLEDREARRAEEQRAEGVAEFNGSLVFLILGSSLNFALIIGLYMFMSRQIRERRSAADSLKLGEQRLQTVVNSIREGITFSNAGGGFEVFNPRMTEITGYSAEEANRAGDFSRLLYPDPADHQAALDGVKTLIEQPGPHVSETTITTKSGVKKLLQVSSQMLIQAGRKMFLTTYSEVTEQRRLEQALRESEEKLRLIFENALDGISIFEETDNPGERRLVECNPRYAELAGRTREELLATGNTEGLAVSLSGQNLKSIAGGNAFRGAFSWKRPDGRENVIEYTAMPIVMRGKKYTIGIDRDVTEARRAEALVRESQQRYHQLFEASPIPIMVYDAGTLAILEVNPASVEHYGYSREEFLAMTVKDIRPAEDVPAFVTHIGTEANREEKTSTWRHCRKDGSIMQVEINSHPVDWENHRARLVLVHDITDLLSVEEELRVQKSHFERLFQSAPEGIALLDGSGIVHDTNAAFGQMFGFLREEMLGRDIVEITIPPGGREEARRALASVLKGENVSLESARLRKDGQLVDVSIIAVPVDNGRGTRMAYVLYRDITQKKRGDREREDLILQLQKALTDVKTLGGLLPICAWCKKIRDDKGYYHQIETFIAKHSEVKFTHGICPECRDRFDREAEAESRESREVHG
ncbi:MAG TPA: PAS domain S-box protein [Bacteroidota bacterium]|nr:PAS domain S-box protein [Bacteroidota bacterium]